MPLGQRLLGHLADRTLFFAVGRSILIDVVAAGEYFPPVEGSLGFGHHIGGLTPVGLVELVVLGIVDVDVGDVLLGVLVPRRTLREEIDVGEAVVFHRLNNDLLGLVRIDRGRPGDVGGTGVQREAERAERLFCAAVGLGFRLVTFRARR